MDREVYTDKAQMVLNDPDAYDKLKSDPTKQLEEMTNLWQQMTENTTIPPTIMNAVIPRHSRCMEWYGLPKDHKPSVQLRPIVSACDTPCETISWLLERILHQLLNFVPAHLSNTEEFISRLRRAFPEGLPSGSLLFTIDVTVL